MGRQRVPVTIPIYKATLFSEGFDRISKKAYELVPDLELGQGGGQNGAQPATSGKTRAFGGQGGSIAIEI